MADEEFESIDAIDKHFGRQIKQAGDDEAKVKELEIERREARADFRDRQSAKRELDSHRTAAIAKAGIPEEWQDLIGGRSTEEIDASVTKMKERLEKITKAQTEDDEAFAKRWGAPPAGGGSPAPPRSTDEEKFLDDFQKRFDDPAGVFSVQEVQKYGQILGGHKLLHGLARNSQIFERAGITPEVVKQYEEGKLPQKRPQKSGVTLAPRA